MKCLIFVILTIDYIIKSGLIMNMQMMSGSGLSGDEGGVSKIARFCLKMRWWEGGGLACALYSSRAAVGKGCPIIRL